MFLHLRYVKQTYCEHFLDAISYSFISLKASFCFLVHAFWPDIFQSNGSSYIEHLNQVIVNKRNKLYSKLSSE